MASKLAKYSQKKGDSQKKKFISTAQEVEADESETAFEEKLRRIGQHKPDKQSKD